MEKETEKVKSAVAEKEEKILQFWQDNKIFEKSLQKPSPNGEFVFFDGPPFATGLPHYGHILPGTVKDIIPRYQTMRGKSVARKWGWDCHGLPIENLLEKELGLKSKKDIENYGVENFNDKAKGVVMRYADDWKKIIPRTGRWVDMEDDYKTMDTKYTESVWWAFKNLYDKGLIYTAFKSMHLCPHCGTTLANFEVNQGYKDITDISVYIKFELVDEPKTYFLAWTTTPWTLPGNVALAVGRDVKYVKAKVGTDFFILAKDLVEKVLKKDFEVIEEFSGEKILGKSYKPLFDYYNNDKLENRENGFKVYHGDFVTTTDGTGIVHIAPAFGEDDLVLGQKENLPFIQHVAFDGTFKKEVTDFVGQVKPKDEPGDHGQGHQKADIEVIKYLAGNGTLFEKEKFTHSYPHCWRCDTPLLNYATTSWFLKVTELKDRLVKINEKINWNPENIGSGRFGKWLEGARDWAISRTRYWGAALPVWTDEDGKRLVVGSIADLKNGIGRRNKYFFARHGQSESNADNRRISCKKENNDPLTEKGRGEASLGGDKLMEILKGEKINLVFSSPFMRTRETVEIIAEKNGFAKEKIIFDDRLGEIDCGDWNGKHWGELESVGNVTGVETLDEVRLRVMEFLYEVDEKYEGKNILIVSHGGPLNMFILSSEGLSVKDILAHYYDNPFANAEVRACDFVALPHNRGFEIDLHRPYIDDVVLRDEKGRLLKRTPEVFDCWLESGSMSFAACHYPFENKETFEETEAIFPADFIAEGQDQTRGWFYTMLVLGVGLFDKSPYENVVVNGMILAEDGRKMSKSLNNYPDPLDVIDKYGADALRYYLVTSPVVSAEDLNFSERGVDEVCKKIIQRTQNVLSFYEMYRPDADVAGSSGTTFSHTVREISVADEANGTATLGHLNIGKDNFGTGTPDADVAGVLRESTDDFVSVLDRWMLTRLSELLSTVTDSLDSYRLSGAARPIADFVDDLSTWYLRRSRDRFKSDNAKEKLNASQNLAFIMREFSKIIAPFMPFLAEEIFQSLRTENDAESVHLSDWPDLSKIAFDPDLIEKMKTTREVVTAALELRQKSGIKVRQPLQKLKVKSYKLESEYEELIKDEVNVKEIVVDEKIEGEIELDTVITDELKTEGLAREIIRAIQDARKKENLSPSDTVSLTVSTDEYLKNILESDKKNILSVTMVKEIFYLSEKQIHETNIDEHSFSITVS
jgi:isoleucyl-tRNA synthetase